MKIKLKTTIILYYIVTSSLIIISSTFLTLYSLKIESENIIKFEIKNKFEEIKSIIKYISKDKNINKKEILILNNIFKNDLIQIIENNKILFKSTSLKNNLLHIKEQNNFYKKKIKDGEIIYYSNFIYPNIILQVGLYKNNIEIFKKIIFYETIELMFALLLTILFSILIAKLISIPIEKIIYDIKNIKIDNLNEKIDFSSFSNYEISELAKEFNKLIDKVYSLIRAQRIFLSNVSHELRSPLTSIIGHSELIKKRGILNNQIIENSSEIIIKEANRLVNLVNELISIEKIQSKDFTLEKVNLYNLLKDIYEIFYPICPRINFKSLQKNLEVLGNEDYLKRAFINLIDNAIYATKNKGEISISIDKIDNYAKIIIKDTGIGIEQEKIKYIFDRFYKIDTNNSNHNNKIGLGLSIVKEIIENHNGKILVNSIFEKETTFEIFLPIITN
ncbi:MAG: two-component sensor histidine kinase [Candidatus Sericytochromatia bacterium]|nr:MAG: two-component sensor histidine kinase [Candidatus Sericytochromatia bacterium]